MDNIWMNCSAGAVKIPVEIRLQENWQIEGLALGKFFFQGKEEKSTKAYLMVLLVIDRSEKYRGIPQPRFSL